VIPTLTKRHLEEPRTQADLRSWVDSLHSALGSTDAGKRAVRLNDGDLIKEFKEEVWPLSLFADAFYKGRTDLLFGVTVGGQSYDARILRASTLEVVRYLQITQSFDGYQNYVRMLHLEQYGSAPLATPLKRGRGQSEIPKAEGHIVDHKEALGRSLSRVLAAVERKSRMRYERNTALIVEFEDLHFHDDSDRKILETFARERLTCCAAKGFQALYLVSDSKRIALRYDRATIDPLARLAGGGVPS
jgi:hypothetical protein